MQRYEYLDSIRGLLFIPMLIYHIVVFMDLKNGTKYGENVFIDMIGNVRLIYIFVAGISIYLYYQKKKDLSIKDYIDDRMCKSKNIILYALIITIVSHVLFPTIGIKFGILHFMFLGTLIVGILLKLKINLPVVMICCYILSQGNNVNLILGPLSSYSSMDWFPILTYLPLLISGTIFGTLIHKKNYDIKENVFSWMGKHSLELYFSHFIFLLIYSSQLFPVLQYVYIPLN